MPDLDELLLQKHWIAFRLCKLSMYELSLNVDLQEVKLLLI